MLGELIGKWCFGYMRPSLFFVCMLFPIFAVSAYLYVQIVELHTLQEYFYTSLAKGKKALERRAIQERFLTRYQHFDPYFLDQYIEPLSYLGDEEREVRRSIAHPAIAHKSLLEERLHFLADGENRISFTEQNIQLSSSVKETEERQRYPVQMNTADVQKFLSLVEDIPIGEYTPVGHSPQLLIQYFHLKRYTSPLNTEVFLVETNLLKREFTQ